jgi:antitoxin (DNA-binding transcriptional repressor) of toxin-antitoxin stability system
MSVRSSVMRASAVRPVPAGSETCSSEEPAPAASLVAGSAARRPASSANARLWLASQLERSSDGRLVGRRNEISSSGMPPVSSLHSDLAMGSIRHPSVPEISGGRRAQCSLEAWCMVRRNLLSEPAWCRSADDTLKRRRAIARLIAVDRRGAWASLRTSDTAVCN